jgi:hypothetical protein
MDLLSAIQTKDSYTENGMSTNSTSLNSCVDLFFQIGAMRGKDKQALTNAFTKAFGEDQLTAMRLLFWARDIRGGAGERQIFKDLIVYLSVNRTQVLGKNLHLITEFGRWDDLLVLLNTPLKRQALELIAKGLSDKNQLCAKWMPRGNNRQTKGLVNIIRHHLKLSPKEYRNLIVSNSSTVEQLMCAKEFDKIEYSKLPSKAMSDLMKAFSANDLVRFQEYLGSVAKGEVKINAGAVYPYDIVKNLNNGSVQGANVQWDALPNYMVGNTERVIPLVDVSGSMVTAAGGSTSITCMDVAISLGLYISERNVGAFKDAFITFHSKPELIITKGSLSERYEQMKRSAWGMNTNLQAAFKLILQNAVNHSVPADSMPTMLIIFSDMEFDDANTPHFRDTTLSEWNPTAQEMISDMYSDAGYVVPKIVYWNLNARNQKNSPVKYDESGTALVSGFSPALLTSLLAGDDLSPVTMMNRVVNSERYESITI